MTNPKPQQQKDELLPCPFCGGSAELLNGYAGWYVTCKDYCSCAVQPSSYSYKDKDKAIAAWNHRPQPTPLPLQDKASTENAFMDWFAESDAHVNTKQERDQLEAAFNAGVAFAGQSAASRNQTIDEVLAIIVTNAERVKALKPKGHVQDRMQQASLVTLQGIIDELLALKTSAAKSQIKYTNELDALFDNYLKTDPDIQRAMAEFVELRKRNINEECKRAGLPKPYLLDGEERIMSWSVSAEVTKENAVDQIMKLESTSELDKGASYQLIKAKEFAVEAIASEAVKGEKFGVSLSGHSQTDYPASAPDSITVSIYARA
jgi:hypothetical protein